jgi:hypothetical protein
MVPVSTNKYWTFIFPYILNKDLSIDDNLNSSQISTSHIDEIVYIALSEKSFSAPANLIKNSPIYVWIITQPVIQL